MTAADMRDMGERPAIAEFAAMSPYDRALLRLTTIARKAHEAGIPIGASSIDVDADETLTVIYVRSIALADQLASVVLVDAARTEDVTYRGTRLVTHRERHDTATVEVHAADLAGVA